jgi:hypothetical protein
LKQKRSLVKMKALALAIFTVLTAGFLLAGTAEAQATHTPFTGTQTCTDVSPGEVTFPDGNVHVRGATSTCEVETTLPDAQSTSHNVLNLNLDATGSGPMWGTFSSEIDGVTILEGAWTGAMTGMTVWTIRAVAQGRGDLEGGKLFVIAECHAVPGGSECDLSGYVLTP